MTFYDVGDDEPRRQQFFKHYFNQLWKLASTKVVAFCFAAITLVALLGVPAFTAQIIYQELTGHVMNVPTDTVIAVLASICAFLVVFGAILLGLFALLETATPAGDEDE